MTSESGDHYYCDEGTDEDPTPVHRCNERGRWWGAEFCPHPGQPCIDGCYYCGRPVLSIDGNHNHTMVEKHDDPTKERYSCVCETC